MNLGKDNTVIYQASNGALELNIDVARDDIWASQKDLSLIYSKDQSVISRHIKNIFTDNEVDEKSNMQFLHIANSDKPVKYYSLDIILAVGYRVSSSEAIAFRKWASKILKQHIVDGYTINTKVLEQNKSNFDQAMDVIKRISLHNDNIAKDDLITKGEATSLFAQEKIAGALELNSWECYAKCVWARCISKYRRESSSLIIFYCKKSSYLMMVIKEAAHLYLFGFWVKLAMNLGIAYPQRRWQH